MTVCIAAILKWDYGTADVPDIGSAAITISDRMLTAHDVQYEPNQQKVALIGSCLILVAGELYTHSQAIADTKKEVGDRNVVPYDIALIYGRAIQAINRQNAENVLLAPLGLNTDSFLAQQRDFSGGFVDTITTQLQNWQRTDTEALVVGPDTEGMYIYSVDSQGSVANHSDAGFAAIGLGAWHAKSRLMQSGFINSKNYNQALTSIYTAKKAAELAPGVGKSTDINLVLRNQITPVLPDIIAETDRLHGEYLSEVALLGKRSEDGLDIFFKRRRKEIADEQAKLDQSTQGNAGTPSKSSVSSQEDDSAEEAIFEEFADQSKDKA